MATLLQDLRYALRGLARSPAFSCVAVLALASLIRRVARPVSTR